MQINLNKPVLPRLIIHKSSRKMQSAAIVKDAMPLVASSPIPQKSPRQGMSTIELVGLIILGLCLLLGVAQMSIARDVNDSPQSKTLVNDPRSNECRHNTATTPPEPSCQTCENRSVSGSSIGPTIGNQKNVQQSALQLSQGLSTHMTSGGNTSHEISSAANNPAQVFNTAPGNHSRVNNTESKSPNGEGDRGSYNLEG